MKIMHIIDSWGELYGAEVMLLDLMAGQKKLGLDPLLCSIGTPDKGEKKIERQARIRGFEVTAIRFRAGLNPYGVYRILQTAWSNRVDILHSHGYKGNILAGCIPRTVRKIPLICTQHGWANARPLSKMALNEWLDQWMLQYMDAVIVVNKLMLNHARLKNAKISADKLYVVNNGIDLESQIPDVSSGTGSDLVHNFIRDSFIIGAIGRLSTIKGYEYLLEATALLHQAGHIVRLVIIGDGPLKDDLHRKVELLGIGDIVLFTGYQANASHYLRYFDVLAISSLSEGLPITLLEAMRAGTPVIATRVGGIPDVITDAESGILVSPANAYELYEAIKLIISNSMLSESLCKQAKLKLMECYSSDKMALDYLNIYNKIT